MDEILRDFLTETSDTIESVDRELVRFEQEPNNETVLAHIFRLVHTIKGTCGFLGLPRLEALAHAAESMIGHFREGAAVTSDAVTLTLATIDRIKLIIKVLEETAAEPEGDDADLIAKLDRQVTGEGAGSEPAGEAAAEIAMESSVESAALGLIARLAPELPPELEAMLARQAPAPEPPAQVPAAPLAAPATPAAAPRQQEGRPLGVQSIRVGLDTLESLMTMVSELVLTRNQLIEIARRNDNADFKVPLQRLSSVTAELQERVMKTRMQPISTAWQKLPRLTRDLCAELGKDIELVLTGAETELDRQVLELVKDPFTHLIRNAADHGIELPQERIAKGKPSRGMIRVSAAHESGTITIEVSDDGRGLDVARIGAKAVERGLANPGDIERMSPERVARFIFEPGFTTVSHVTHVSGRGVGMDVVRSNIELIGGSVDVRWVPGNGTTFSMKIPLTLAIVAALIIETAGQRYAIPQATVVELVQARTSSEQRFEQINGTWLLRLRDMLVPVVRLAVLLGQEGADAVEPGNDGFVVVMRVGKRVYGVAVDAVFHTEEIVVKPMSGPLRNLSLFSGNTILGDGAVILILDPNGMLGRIGETPLPSRSGNEEAVAIRRQLQEERTSFLVFRAGDGDLKAVPLAAVTRLEEFDVSSIETVGGRSVAQYRGELIPIMRASPTMSLRSGGVQPVLVFSEQDRTAGLAVDEIVDIVEDHVDISATGQSPGIIGSAVIRGRATEIIDIAHYLPLAYPDWFESGAADKPQRPQRVLLVERAPFFRGMLVPVLKAERFEVVALAEVDAALELLERGDTFDAIVADIDAPDRNGFDIAETLAGDRRLPQIPVIAIASRRRADALDRARRLGLADVVAKFDRAGLVAALTELNDFAELAA